jgi:hypothetical protein
VRFKRFYWDSLKINAGRELVDPDRSGHFVTYGREKTFLGFLASEVSTFSGSRLPTAEKRENENPQ